MLGEDRPFVEVLTSGRVVIKLLSQAGSATYILGDSEINTLLRQAIQQTRFDDSEQQQSQRQAIEQMSLDYLLQKINQVIVARQIHMLKDYLTAARPGRKLPLRGLQSRAVWGVFETLQQSLSRQSKITWCQTRAMADVYVAQGAYTQFYNAVIVDEAQDLDPSALRLLVHLCKQSNHLFITADANQSIYSSDFNWIGVYQDLKFHGRTAILDANYRSTREIGEAAQRCLAGGVLDTDTEECFYINNDSSHYAPHPGSALAAPTARQLLPPSPQRLSHEFWRLLRPLLHYQSHPRHQPKHSASKAWKPRL
ncbi:hypothetical protein KDH_66530 [Dictyobacter sp. S3.2.2.5]|uniref:UvrD-like helicase ATP-binding domain-containing protein n=1 Tax=Dictyobacter halimunensis TaxID=3026934 RepID=A0ABQ6FZZ0_9CHLR|nr:hypothetical protein KDH_66530 [Dictyobacter sp. S3.2.2.5]